VNSAVSLKKVFQKEGKKKGELSLARMGENHGRWIETGAPSKNPSVYGNRYV